MSGVKAQQALLSEKLLLLNKLDYLYSKPKSPPLSKGMQIELEILDAIASILTAERGDVFAAAFDRSNNFIKIILAKNGKPTMADKESAKAFFALIVNPEVNNATDVFPFLLEHRRGCLNMRIKKLHGITTDAEFNQHFHSYLDRYVAKCTDPSLEA